MTQKVLVETRFVGAELGGLWHPYFISKVYGETPERYAVKRRWWRAVEWTPKNGVFTRCREVASAAAPEPTEKGT